MTHSSLVKTGFYDLDKSNVCRNYQIVVETAFLCISIFGGLQIKKLQYYLKDHLYPSVPKRKFKDIKNKQTKLSLIPTKLLDLESTLM